MTISIIANNRASSNGWKETVDAGNEDTTAERRRGGTKTKTKKQPTKTARLVTDAHFHFWLVCKRIHGFHHNAAQRIPIGETEDFIFLFSHFRNFTLLEVFRSMRK